MVSKAKNAVEWQVYKPRRWGRPKRSRKMVGDWWGLDTERDSLDGDFVCGFVVGDRGGKKFRGFDDLDRGIYWIHNLGYDIEGMLRDYGLKWGVEELWAAKADGAKFELEDGVKGVYYHNKRFEWDRGNGDKLLFLDSSAFFGRLPLKELGAKGGVDASKMSKHRYEADEEYRREVDAYCLQDARIVYESMRNLERGVGKYGVDLASTPGATAKRFLGKMPGYPRVIWQSHKSFLKSYCGGRFELAKRGVFDGVVRKYDLVSAYPWALTECPWLGKDAYMRHGRRLSDGAIYGSYCVSFGYRDYLGLAPVWKGPTRIFSRGEEKCWLTRPEVEWLQKKGVDYEIHRSVEIFDEGASDLWREVIVGLFKDKQKAGREGDKFAKWGAKILLNTQYGILIQLIRKSGEWVELGAAKNPVDFAGKLALEAPEKAYEAGQYYAPVYAANLTALVRLKILDAAENTGYENYIGGHTDSVHTMGRLDSGLIGKGLGAWELEKESEGADICKTGMYSMGGEVKIRGITREGETSMLWEDNHVRKSRVGIKMAGGWGELSVIKPKVVVNNIHIENKRKWDREFSRKVVDSREWIDSEALSYVNC